MLAKRLRVSLAALPFLLLGMAWRGCEAARAGGGHGTAADDKALTYTKDVVPILGYTHCLACHRKTILDVVAHYDNTAGNPRNPNSPPKVVRWGEATTDEMCIGFIILAKKDQDLTSDGEKDDLVKLIKDSGGAPVLDQRARKKE